MSEDKKISVPAEITVRIDVVILWLNELDWAIAAERDAGRVECAKKLAETRASIARQCPASLRLDREG